MSSARCDLERAQFCFLNVLLCFPDADFVSVLREV